MTASETQPFFLTEAKTVMRQAQKQQRSTQYVVFIVPRVVVELIMAGDIATYVSERMLLEPSCPRYTVHELTNTRIMQTLYSAHARQQHA